MPGSAVGGDRLGQPRPRVLLALHAGRAQHVERPPGRDRDEPGLRLADRGPVGGRPALGDVADDVLGLRPAAQHPVGDAEQPGPGRLEGVDVALTTLHDSGVAPGHGLQHVRGDGGRRPPRRTGSTRRRASRPGRPSRRRGRGRARRRRRRRDVRRCPRVAGRAWSPLTSERGHVAGVDDVVAPVRLVGVEDGLEARAGGRRAPRRGAGSGRPG